MNYFEIINAILLELNYQQVASFEDLTQIEHKRIMNIVNRLNKEVCSLSEKFAFRQMIYSLKLYKNKIEYEIPFSGKISQIIGKNNKYSFEPEYEKFFQNKISSLKYGLYGEKLLFPQIDDAVKIFYVTEEFVKDSDNFKENFEKPTDESIIPANFIEQIFVNGGAYNFKQNTSHPKYVHWKQEFDKAISELLAGSKKNSCVDFKIDGGFRKI